MLWFAFGLIIFGFTVILPISAGTSSQISNAYGTPNSELWVILVEDRIRLEEAMEILRTESTRRLAPTISFSGTIETPIPGGKIDGSASWESKDGKEVQSKYRTTPTHHSFKVSYGKTHNWINSEKMDREFMTILARPIHSRHSAYLAHGASPSQTPSPNPSQRNSQPSNKNQTLESITDVEYNPYHSGNELALISQNYKVTPGRNYIVTPKGDIKLARKGWDRNPFVDENFVNWSPYSIKVESSKGFMCLGECQSFGYKYNWCRLETGHWDYCSKTKGMDYKNLKCTEECAFHGQHYQWCKSKTRSGRHTWGYCSHAKE